MRTLVAGVGNLFFGDDGFGVEVARQLQAAPPANTKVTDFGIRALHLAYELLEPVDLCIVADCVSRGAAPGTLFVIEPADHGDAIPEGHAMHLPSVFATVEQMGGRLPRTLIVGCEPAQVEPGIGLSADVTRAIPEALALIHRLVKEPS